MATKTNRLSTRGVQTITKPGRHADGGNLYLNVSKTGARSWVFFYRYGARMREMGLGNLRDVPLARAREVAASHRQTVAAGIDPMTTRDVPKVATFGEFAEQYIETMGTAWRNAKHRAQWSSTLKTYAASIWIMPVDAVGTDDVLKALTPIWTTKAETASRVRGRIEAVLNAATTKKLRSGENPARWRGHLANVLPKRTKASRSHHAALPLLRLPDFMKSLEATEGVSARALEFTILCAARSGETLGARWNEIDIDAGIWTVPAERMKAGVEHTVPLSMAAKAILREMATVKISDFVFPGAKPNCPLSVMALDMVVRRMKVIDATVHGFRSTFRDWASEETSFSHEVCEMALAHTIKNKAEAAYRRGSLFEKRRQLMAAWDRACQALEHEKVVTIGGTRHAR